MKTLILAFFIATTVAYAQDSLYSKVYYTGNLDLKGQSVTSSGDGGLVIASQYNWTQSGIMRLDSLGNILWGKSLAGASGTVQTDNVLIKTINVLKDSSFIVAGQSQSNDGIALNAFCAKISRNGDTLWTRTVKDQLMPYNTYEAACGSLDSGIVLLAKKHDSFTAGFLVVKYDRNGNMVWSKVFNGLSVTENAYRIVALSDSSFVLTVPKAGNESIVMRILSNGSVAWSQTYPETIIHDLEVVDSSFVFSSVNTTSYQLMLVKLSVDGTFQWAKVYDAQLFGTNMPIDVTVREDSSFLFSSGEQFWMGFVLSADKNGVGELQAHLGLASFAVLPSTNNGFFVVGNGPLYGVKGASLMTNYHIGVSRADSSLNFFNGGFFSCGWGTQPLTSTDHILPPLSFSPIQSGSVQVVSNAFQFSELILDSYIGCVDFLGGLDDNSIEKELTVFPNPSNGVFQVEQESQHTLELTITDVNGRIILQKSMQSLHNTVDLSAEKSGIYFYHAIRDDGQTKSGKLVVLQ